MPKQTPIQLYIPSPCHEDWQAMTPCEQGRFCGSCQKTVIDFTGWSDKALFDFFTTSDQTVCGRVKTTQLKRTITLPTQPSTRLYRLAVALGLTLMFAQIPDAHTMVMQPMEHLSRVSENISSEDTSKNGLGIVRGAAMDENGEPVIGAVIEIYRDSIKIAVSVTDIDGNYEIRDLEPGIYKISSKYVEYNRVTITGISVTIGKPIEVPIKFRPTELYLIGYIAPLKEDYKIK